MNNHPLPDFLHNEPKWQAIIPDQKKWFYFKDGTRVSNLWELRLALASVSDEVLAEMLGSGYNYIANWVRDVVGDVCLSDLFYKGQNRWDLIVDLERHMIRTLALPSYLAIRWLDNANHPFVPAGGQPIACLREFSKQIINPEGEAYKHLVNRPGDVIAWVRDSIGDYLLADLLEASASKDALQILVQDHIALLEYSEKIRCCNEEVDQSCKNCC